MTASEAKPTAHRSQSAAAPYTNPYLGIVGVFLGAGLATLNARLVGVGLADLRGAKGFGFDEASWIPTALNMATMFSGVFVVFVNALFGPRRILLPAAAIFTLVSAMLPFVPGYWPMLAADCDCGPLFGNLLFPDDDLRIDGAAQTADHLRDRGICGGHCVHQQYRQLCWRAGTSNIFPGHGSSGLPRP